MSSVGRKLLYTIAAGLLCTACTLVGYRVLAGEPARTLSLRELASQGATLMSCADESAPAGALLWCADPDSSHCIPALPEAPGTDLGQHGPLAVLTPMLAAPRRSIVRLIAWPEPRAARLAPIQLAQRLERPPKRA